MEGKGKGPVRTPGCGEGGTGVLLKATPRRIRAPSVSSAWSESWRDGETWAAHHGVPYLAARPTNWGLWDTTFGVNNLFKSCYECENVVFVITHNILIGPAIGVGGTIYNLVTLKSTTFHHHGEHR